MGTYLKEEQGDGNGYIESKISPSDENRILLGIKRIAQSPGKLFSEGTNTHGLGKWEIAILFMRVQKES